MAQLASVCGSDGHTYSSVVRSLGPVWGGGGVYPMPLGTEGPLADPLKIPRIDTGLRQYVQRSPSDLDRVIQSLAGRGQGRDMKRCLGKKCKWGSQGKVHKSAQSPGWKEGSSCGQLQERRKDFHTEVLLLASQQGAMWAGHGPHQKR